MQCYIISIMLTRDSFFNLEVRHPRCVGSNNKGVLCIIHTVEHNYIYVLVHKEIQLHVSVLYVDQLQVEY